MKPITVLWSDGVSEAEAKESIGAMRDFLRYLQSVADEQDIGLAPIVLRPYGNWILKGTAGEEAYHSFRWYWESSLDHNTGQVSAAMFIEIVRFEPWQHVDPHLDLALLHTELRDDLTETSGEFPSVFAYTEPDLVAVVSLRHLAQIADNDLRLRCLRLLVMHNFGLLIGLPSGLQCENRRQAKQAVAPEQTPARRCELPCIMFTAQSIDELMAAATASEDDSPLLCKGCREVVRSIVFSLHFCPN